MDSAGEWENEIRTDFCPGRNIRLHFKWERRSTADLGASEWFGAWHFSWPGDLRLFFESRDFDCGALLFEYHAESWRFFELPMVRGDRSGGPVNAAW